MRNDVLEWRLNRRGSEWIRIHGAIILEEGFRILETFRHEGGKAIVLNMDTSKNMSIVVTVKL
jgi:hypothetical protein